MVVILGGVYNPGIAINTWIIYIYIYDYDYDLYDLYMANFMTSFSFAELFLLKMVDFAAGNQPLLEADEPGSLEPIARTRSFSKGLGLGFGQAQEGEEGEKKKKHLCQQ